MPNIDLSILNQRQTPAFYADTLANRPAAGFVGRIFVSTNTFAFYRDNGTGWDLIGGPGTGTVTGTGANGQVTFWNGASTITGSNDLFWDATNGHFGVNTNAPGTALDVHHDQPTVTILNQTVATNDVRIGFQNNGVGLWRIGAFYNAGANDFGIYDAVAAIQPVTVKKTTGQVLIGTSTVGSGKLVVASNIGDNGIQIVGASAPSLRIDSAESGPTKRAGLGISTATNNFIQGSADRDFCIFNGSTTASPILLGIYDAGAGNVQEGARISPARNFLIGTTTDTGFKLNVNGAGNFNGAVRSLGYIGDYGAFNTTTPVNNYVLDVRAATNKRFGVSNSNSLSGASVLFYTDANAFADGYIDAIKLVFQSQSSGNVLIGTTTDAGFKLDVNGTFRASNVLSGAYAPTASSLANFTTVTPLRAQYMRVGNVVTVSGNVDITPVTTGTSSFQMSLPITNGNFTSLQQGSGSGCTNVTFEPTLVRSVAATVLVEMSMNITYPLPHTLYYTFTYEIQ